MGIDVGGCGCRGTGVEANRTRRILIATKFDTSIGVSGLQKPLPEASSERACGPSHDTMHGQLGATGVLVVRGSVFPDDGCPHSC